MSMSKNWDLEFIAQLIFKSSKKALAMQPDLAIHEKVIDKSVDIYTNVDVEIEKDISTALTSNSDVSIIGEESIHAILQSTNIETLFEKPTFVIDPIDGTQNYINKLPNWAISIGLIEDMEFKEGALTLPTLGELFISNNDSVYSSIHKSQLSEIAELSLSQFHKPPLQSDKHLTYSKAQMPFRLQYHANYRAQMNRSCVYSVAKIISGSYFAYIGKANIWDYAGCIGLFRALALPVYYYDPDKKELNVLPWKISTEHWKDYTYTVYPLVFATSYELAASLIPA